MGESIAWEEQEAKFPHSLGVCESVLKERDHRFQSMMQACFIGSAIRLCVVLIEFLGFYFFKSASLFSDALSNFGDVATSALLLLSMWYASRPPDTKHPFGHGRVEPLMGLQLGVLMVAVGGGLFLQQVFSFSSIEDKEPIVSFAWCVPLCALILLEIGCQITQKIAKMQNSPALAADAIHYRVDALTSASALFVLGLGAYFPEWSQWFDWLGAVSISLFMIVVGVNAIMSNLHPLIDRTPDSHFFSLVKQSATQVTGVLGVEKIRIQMTGPCAHVDIDVEVDPSLSVAFAHRISQYVRAEIQKAWPLVQEVVVHIEPFYPDDHETHF